MGDLDLAGLKAMLAEATPGPWAWRIEPQRYPECDDVDLPATVSGSGAHIAWLNERYDTNVNQVNDKDAALIVAAVNSLPALIRRIEELEAFAQRVASGEAFRCQRFAEDDDAEYFLRAQRQVLVEARTLTPAKGR